MNRWIGRVAIVTGASGGIGLAVAQALVREGMVVFGLARRKDMMEEKMKLVNGKGAFYGIQCDVANENEVMQAFSLIEKSSKTVHVLVNNAGICNFNAAITDLDSDQIRKILAVNVMGVLYCSQRVIKLMREGAHEGHIINMSSIVGLSNVIPPIVPLNIYSATKRAVTGISETLRAELKGGKIRVTNICPGLVKTNITPDGAVPDDEPILNCSDIADSIVYILGTPPHVQVTELTIKPLGEKM